VTYLCSQFDIADHWYPKDPKKRAKVDEYLSWQHLNLRFFGSMLFRHRVMAGKKVPNPQCVADRRPTVWRYLNGMAMSVDALERIFLANGKHKYLNGFSEITFADLWCCAEFEQPAMAGLVLCR